MPEQMQDGPPLQHLDPKRFDPSLDRRRLVLFSSGLVATYLAAVAVFWPSSDDDPSDFMFLFIMFAPTVGALLARFSGPGVIRWGRPNRWIVAGLIPSVAALGAYLIGAAVGLDAEDPGVLADALTVAGFSILSGSLSAVGEEIGWRGFLWPLVRGRHGFLWTSGLVGGVWWFYHVPLILLGWYGDLGGLAAFTVGIAGFSLFVGVLTDRSGSIWPSVIAHGAWNSMVATSFAATEGDDVVPAFTGSQALLGEFGWLAAISSLVVGVAAARWHVSHRSHTRSTHPPRA